MEGTDQVLSFAATLRPHIMMMMVVVMIMMMLFCNYKKVLHLFWPKESVSRFKLKSGIYSKFEMHTNTMLVEILY